MVRVQLTTLVVGLCFSIAKSSIICSTIGVHCRHDRECCSGFCNYGVCSWVTSGVYEVSGVKGISDVKGVSGVKRVQYVDTYDPTIKQAYVTGQIANNKDGISAEERGISEYGDSYSGSSSLPYCDELSYSSSYSDLSYDQSRDYSENELSESGVSAEDRSGDSSPENKSVAPSDPSNAEPEHPSPDGRSVPEQDSRRNSQPAVNWPTDPAADWQCTKDSEFCRRDSECCSRLCQQYTCGSRTSSPTEESLCRPDYSPCNQASDCCSQECVADTIRGGVCVPRGSPFTPSTDDYPKEKETAYQGEVEPFNGVAMRPLPAIPYEPRGYRNRGESTGMYPPTTTSYSRGPLLDYWNSPKNSIYPNNMYSSYPYGRLQQNMVRPFGPPIKTLPYPVGSNYPTKGISNVNMYEPEVYLEDIRRSTPTRTHSMESSLDTSDGRHYNSYDESTVVENVSSLIPGENVDVYPFGSNHLENEENNRDATNENAFESSSEGELPHTIPSTSTFDMGSQLDRSDERHYKSVIESTEDYLSEHKEESHHSIDSLKDSLDQEEDINLSNGSHLRDYGEESFVTIDNSKQSSSEAVIWLQHKTKAEVNSIERDRDNTKKSNIYESEVPTLADFSISRSPSIINPMVPLWGASDKRQYNTFGNVMEDHLNYDEGQYQDDPYFNKRVYSPPNWPPYGIKGKLYNVQPQVGYSNIQHKSRIPAVLLPNNKLPARTYSMGSTVDTLDDRSYRESLEAKEYLQDFPVGRYRDFYKINQVPQKTSIWPSFGIKGHAVRPFFNNYFKEDEFRDSLYAPEYADATPPGPGLPTRTFSIESSVYMMDERQHSLNEESQEILNQPNILQEENLQDHNEGSYQSDISSSIYETDQIYHTKEFQLSQEIEQLRGDDIEMKETKQVYPTYEEIDQSNFLDESVEVEDQLNVLPEDYPHGYGEGSYNDNEDTYLYEIQDIPKEQLVEPYNEITEVLQPKLDDNERKENEDITLEYDLNTLKDIPLSSPEKKFEPFPNVEEHAADVLRESIQPNLQTTEDFHKYDEGIDDHIVDINIIEEPQIPYKSSKEMSIEFDLSREKTSYSMEFPHEHDLSTIEEFSYISSPTSRSELSMNKIYENTLSTLGDSIELEDQSTLPTGEHFPSYYEGSYRSEIDIYDKLDESLPRTPSGPVQLEPDERTEIELHDLSAGESASSDMYLPDDKEYQHNYEETLENEGHLEKTYNIYESTLSDEAGVQLSPYSVQESIEEFPRGNADHYKENVKTFNVKTNYNIRNIPNLRDTEGTYSEEFVFEKQNNRRSRNYWKRMCNLYHGKCRHRKRHKKCKERQLNSLQVPSEDTHTTRMEDTPALPENIPVSLPSGSERDTEDLVQRPNPIETTKTNSGLGLAGWITHGARQVVG